jgi:2-oxoglutarate decarboxylase
MPEMNNGFAEVDGKPNLVKPEHVNLGLAIDVQKPDGTRSCWCRRSRAPTRWTSPQFWTAYEDIVRKAATTSSGPTTSRAPRSA